MANNVLLLGGTGLVGGYLSQALSDHCNVYAPTRQQLNLQDTHSVLQLFNQKDFDIVINCAGSTNSDMVNYDPEVTNTNLGIFANLYAARNRFGRLINFGSGAEFDRRMNITSAREEDIFIRQPVDHYGQSKNFSARLCFDTENFYTLRLFGVFGPSEPSRRLLKRIIAKEPTEVEDKYFDYYYIEDILPVVLYYINNTPKFKDLNLVYPEKTLLSYFVKQFCDIHKLNSDHITISTTTRLNYTGSSVRIEELNLPLLGVKEGLRRYQ
jgi:UDP-glucose 4-epimerase